MAVIHLCLLLLHIKQNVLVSVLNLVYASCEDTTKTNVAHFLGTFGSIWQ